MSGNIHDETIGFDDPAASADAATGVTDVSSSPPGQPDDEPHTETDTPASHLLETIAPVDLDAPTSGHIDEPASEQTPDTRRPSRDSGRKARRRNRGRITSRSGRRLRNDPGGMGYRPEVGDTVHHYEIIRELGRGGMGVVYLARDLRLARRVAVKFVRAEHAGSTERFLIEARATARCQHENIVIIYDIDEYAGSPFMVLEYLQGRALSELLDGKPIPPQRAVELMIPVARALQRAHEFGIVHRDLKPANIFVTDAGVVKVLDFGIAKHRDHSAASSAQITLPEYSDDTALTRAGALIGTVPYMSPEQLSGADIDHQTDLWAFGIILHEMVTGRHPLAPLSPETLTSITELDTPMLDQDDPVPGAGKLGLLIARCLIKRKADRIGSASELLDELVKLAPGQDRLVLDEDESPFAGLAAFQESEADRFFGRSHEIANIATQLQSHPLVTLVGPSGSGKSSLIRAGVIPALKRSGDGWHSLVVRPGRAPLTTLARMLGELAMETSTSTNASDKLAAPDQNTLTSTLADEPGYLGQTLRDWSRRKRRKLIMLVDQFEELYTLGATADERTAFVTCLEGVADDASSPLRVVLSIRSDFLDRVVEDNQFTTAVTSGLVLLPPIGRSGLREALVRPVEAASYQFEDDALVEVMLDALETTPGALPLLQFTATKLWDSRDREQRLLTRKSYNDIGGVAGTLASHADAVLAGMPPARRALTRAVFLRLVTPERTRDIASLAELRDLPGDASEIEHVVRHLSDARLLAIETSGGHDSTVELIHESLIASWPTLRRWLDDNQDDAEFLARLRAAARQWHGSSRAEGMLWRGEPAQEAHRWDSRFQGELPAIERAYLDAVFGLEARARRRKRRVVLGAIAVLTGLLIAAVIALVLIRQAQQEAHRQAGIASQQLQQLQREQAARQAAQEQLQDALDDAKQARDKAENKRTEAERQRAEAERQRKLADEQRALAEQESARADEQRQLAESERENARAAAAKARAAEGRSTQAAKEAEEAEGRALAAKARAEDASKQLKDRLEQEQTQLKTYRRVYGIPARVDLDRYDKPADATSP